MFTRLRQRFARPHTLPIADPVFALPDGVRVYAVGDIHGRADLLAQTLSAIEADAATNPAPRILQVFLGDYIDRGMQSREVIDLLLAPPPKGHERICLMGNHEETLLRFLEDPSVLRSWGNYGGYATLAAYGIAIPNAMTPAHLAHTRDRFRANLPDHHLQFLRHLKLCHELGDYFFVHAGIAPDIALDAQQSDALLWIRERFLNHRGFFPRYIVHGHTPVPEPDIRNNRANLDVSGNLPDRLCCLVMQADTRRTMLVGQKRD